MAYNPPVLRDCSSLFGDPVYPDTGTVLDLAGFNQIPPGVPKRLVAVGTKICIEGTSTPVKLVGVNVTPTHIRPLDFEYQDRIIEKLKALGRNYVRMHQIEATLKYTTLYGAGFTVRGNRVYDTNRLAELHLFLYKLKQAGIVYSFNPGSRNLAMDTMGGDRWTSTSNTTGTIVLTLDANGGIATATVGTRGTGYGMDAPSIVIKDVAGANGSDAEIQANLNPDGSIKDYTILNPGKNYSPGVTATHYGGMGRCLFRMRFDRRMKTHLRDFIVEDLLNMVSPHTGVAYKDEPALFMVDVINESHLNYVMGIYADGQPGGIPSQLRPQFVNFLSERYGNIATLNAQWGTSYLGWWDDALRPLTKPNSPNGTKANNSLYVDSCRWIDETDVAFYKDLVDAVKGTGYRGLIATRDMVGEPSYGRMYAATGATMQTVHYYIGLCDSYDKGTRYRGSPGIVNGPTGGAYGTGTSIALAHLLGDRPWMFTETGQPLPGVYRGEYGLVYGGYASTHGASGLTIHGPGLSGFVFGSDSSTRADTRPQPFENDVLQPASAWFGCRMFLRGDIDELPVTRTFTCNNKALNNFANIADLAAAGTPSVSYRQSDLGVEMCLGAMTVRYVYAWDLTDSSSIASAYYNASATGESQKNFATRVAEDYATAHASRRWVSTKGNAVLSTNSDRSGLAVAYTPRSAGGQESSIGHDRSAGLFFVDSLRTQALVASPKFAQAAATVVRRGNQFFDNTSRTSQAQQGYGYDKNFDGNNFWHDLVIDYIEDGTFFGVTSYEKVPLSQADRILLCATNNYYFKNATFSPNGKVLAGLTLNGGTGYPAVTEFVFSGNGGMACVLVYATAGVPTSYKIVDGQPGGFGFTNPALFVPTTSIRPIAGAGTGLTFTDYVMADAPESDETVIDTGWAGALGWPIQQKAFSVVARLRNVDVSVPWVLYELDSRGNRQKAFATQRINGELIVTIESGKTTKPTPYYELVKGIAGRRTRT